jgi:hypothetical protein
MRRHLLPLDSNARGLAQLPSALLAVFLAATAAQAQASAAGQAPAETRFTVRIQNVSTASTLELSNGRSVAVPLSGGVWAVHAGANPLFTPGEVEAGLGLKALAEAGLPATLEGNLRGLAGVRSSGVFETPIAPAIRRNSAGEMQREPAPRPGTVLSRMLHPGHRFEFTVSGRPGDRLSLALMVGQSNDGFVAPGPLGIVLFTPDGTPVSGEVTAHLHLWDSGTEVNEEPGLGRNQGLRQGAPHAGDPERRPVRLMSAAEFGDRWPPVERLVRVTITPARR